MENVLSRNSKQWKKKLTEDFFPSFENMKIIFTYIMFTFFKTRNNKKKHLVSLLGNIFFGLQYKQKPFFYVIKKGKSKSSFWFLRWYDQQT